LERKAVMQFDYDCLINESVKSNFYISNKVLPEIAEIKTGHGHAFLESIQDEGENIRFSGWGFVIDHNVKKLPVRFIFTVAQKAIGYALSSVLREDVIQAYGPLTPPQCGFSTLIPKTLLPQDMLKLGIYAQQQDGSLVPLYNVRTQHYFEAFWDRLMPSFRKKIFYYGGQYFQIPHPHCGLTGEELLYATGRNTGNQLFTTAIHRHLGQENIEGRIERAEDCSIHVFSLANDIREGLEPNESLLSMLEKSKQPCCVIGIGAQADDYNKIPSLTPKMIRFLRILSERSVNIGVRGAFSAECLNSIGIKNTRIIGCPSLFYNNVSQPEIEKSNTTRSKRIAFSVSHPNKESKFSPISSLLFKYALNSGNPIVLQEYRPLISLALDNFTFAEWEICKKIGQDFGLEGSDYELYCSLRHSLRVFWDMRDWLSFLREYDFVLGVRIHGCIAGVLAGTPALVVAIDSRTRELSETLNLPWVDAKNITEIDVEALYSQADYRSFNSSYKILYKNYVDFLNENGIPHLLPTVFS